MPICLIIVPLAADLKPVSQTVKHLFSWCPLNIGGQEGMLEVLHWCLCCFQVYSGQNML